MKGWETLFYKEVLRFWKVSFQTVAAPVLTAVLYMLIFGHVLQGQVKVYGTVEYKAFLVPGLVMMSVLRTPSPTARRRWCKARSRAISSFCCSPRCRTGAGSSLTSAHRWRAG